MRYHGMLVVSALALLLCGCNIFWIHSGVAAPAPVVTVPANMAGGADANWSVSWTGGTAPYTIEMDLGGGATANVAAGTAATTPYAHTFTMVNPSLTDNASYTYTVRVTDSEDRVGTATAQYTIGPTNGPEITIDSAVFDAALDRLTVTVSSPDDGETLTVSVTVPAGLAVDDAEKVAAATGPLTATFDWTALDILAGATGDTTITVDNGHGATDTETATITVEPFVLAADKLYAIAAPANVAVGDPVTVTVLTGVPANPFQYLNGIGMTIESDADKVASSFNVGAVGGNPGDVDGFWTAMNPSGGFLLPPDQFIIATNIGGGRERWDFNLTPIGGSDVDSSSGALFNCQFTFATAGTKTFGFQDVNTVNRTYYSDHDNIIYFWGDITNDDAPAVTVE
jgi:hypothetical protein